MLLVLDLDETLVRVRCQGVHKDELESADFNVSIDLASKPNRQMFECGVSVRPGFDAFMKWIQERRRDGLIEGPWIYTAASAKYTKAVLKHIDPGGHVFAMRVLTRDACRLANLPGYLLKDLSNVPPRASAGEDLRRRVLVDNNPVSHVLNPSSAVLVRDWLGKDPADAELRRVQSVLDGVLEAPATEKAAAPIGDHVSSLDRLTPGHAAFRDRLKALRERLADTAPTEVPLLRSALRAVSSECHEIKRELLGAAP